jgi:tetratricopeptide (TPR) repeat protein
MMAAGYAVRRLATAVLVLALPCLVSQCAKKSPQMPAVRPFSSQELANLQALHDPWPTEQSTTPQPLPEDRLQALGDMALKNRNFTESLMNYMQILQKHPKRYDLHYKVGVIFLLTGNFEAAQKELALVLVHRPKMVRAHEALGLVFLQKKQYVQAIDEFQYALSLDSNRPRTYYLLGISFLESGRTERAIQALKMAIAMDHRQIYPYEALARAYLKQKNYPLALASLKQAQSLAPRSQKVNLLLGQTLAAQKQYPQALQAFMKAGDEAKAYNNIGVYYFMDGQYEEAAKCFQRAIELRPTFYQAASTNLQRALEKLQQTQPNGS